MRRLFLFFVCCFFISVNVKAQFKTDEPYVAFVGVQSYEAIITPGNAMKGRALGCMLNGAGLPVQSFKLTVEKNGSKKSASSTTNNMTAEQIAMLQKLTSGSKIIFSEVKVKFQDGKIKTIKDGIYLIK